MKRTQQTNILALAAIAVTLCGCSTANVAFRNYPTTTFAEVPIPPGSSIRVVARDGASKTAQSFAKALARELSSGEGLRLAKKGEKADYWFLVAGASTYRPDSPEQAKFNTSYDKVSNENEYGGREEIKRTDKVSWTSSRGMSIAIYRSEGLAPIHYLELPLLEGNLGPGVETGKDKALETDARFVNLALERVKDVFLTQTKMVSVPVPRESDPELYDAFERLDKAAVAGDAAAIAAARTKIERRAAAILPGSIDAFGKKLKTEEWKGREREAEVILANYHIRALAREAGCLDPEELKAIHAEQLRILELSTMDSLRMACPIALARIEYKLGNL